MPRLTNSVPKYRKHRASGQAIVEIGGKTHYLGPHGTKASKVEYDRLVDNSPVCFKRPCDHRIVGTGCDSVDFRRFRPG